MKHKIIEIIFLSFVGIIILKEGTVLSDGTNQPLSKDVGQVSILENNKITDDAKQPTDEETIRDIENDADGKNISEGYKVLKQEDFPLSQEEYDDLISKIPEGYELYDDVIVQPGVIR